MAPRRGQIINSTISNNNPQSIININSNSNNHNLVKITAAINSVSSTSKNTINMNKGEAIIINHNNNISNNINLNNISLNNINLNINLSNINLNNISLNNINLSILNNNLNNLNNLNNSNSLNMINTINNINNINKLVVLDDTSSLWHSVSNSRYDKIRAMIITRDNAIRSIATQRRRAAMDSAVKQLPQRKRLQGRCSRCIRAWCSPSWSSWRGCRTRTRFRSTTC